MGSTEDCFDMCYSPEIDTCVDNGLALNMQQAII